MDEFSRLFGVNYRDAVSNEGLIYKGEKYRITVLSELLLRLEYSETGAFEDRPTEMIKTRNFTAVDVEVENGDKFLILKTKYFELTYEKNMPFIGPKLAPDQYLKVKLLDTDKVWFFNHAEARNFKSIVSNLDDKNQIPKLEKGLYSTDGFASFDDSKSLIFNEDGSVGKRSDERIDTYLFMYKKDFGFALKEYYKLTGYPPLIPRYALGIWWNIDREYVAEKIISRIEKFEKMNIKLSGIVLNKWSKNDVTPDENLFKNPVETFSLLKRKGIHLGLSLNLNQIPVNINGELSSVPFNVFDKQFLAGYFDQYIKTLLNCGVDFFSLTYKGTDMYFLRMINYYFYNYLNRYSNKRGLILSRNGLVSSHLYPIHNSGETIVSWDLLKMLPNYNSSSSNIGVSWWSHAIGGYKEGMEESLLYARFVEFGTFSPIFRLASKEGHYYKREPWKWDMKTAAIASEYMNLRTRLIPYLYSEAYKYSITGLPICQPLYYRYPELYDEPTYKNEYYFGTEFFIAPITEKKDEVMNRTVVKLFLPNGVWYDFKTGKKFPGGKRYLSFYKDQDYPVFVKQGGIIPMSILKEEEFPSSNPSEFEIHIFPGKSNSYKLYEDDGETRNYNSGKLLTTLIDYNYLPNNYTVIIRPLEGTTEVVPAKRKFKIRFRNTRKADEVIAYVGSTLTNVNTYVDDQDFIVESDYINASEQLSINCKGKDIEIDAVRIINEDIDTIINDLKVSTKMKEKISEIVFSDDDIKKKRIAIRKLSRVGLNQIFIKMFLKLLEYVSQI